MIEIAVRDRAWTDAAPGARGLASRAARAALTRFASGRGLTVALAGDDAVAALNLRFRDKQGPTNVLAFPAAPNIEDHLGDIVLAFGVCAREAREQGKSLGAHLQHLVIHGALHLIGYDHADQGEARAMETIERELLAGLGVCDPYADRDHGDDVHARR